MKTGVRGLDDILRSDGSGEELRRMQRELRANLEKLKRQSGVTNLGATAKAYDAGVALLPEIWRFEQRKY